jgi:hypothetical protein
LVAGTILGGDRKLSVSLCVFRAPTVSWKYGDVFSSREQLS